MSLFASTGNYIYPIDPHNIEMNPRPIKVQYKPQHKLLLTFAEETREFDLTPYLQYPVYRLLQDEGLCRRAKIFNGTVVWNDEIDFDPDTLYVESTPLSTQSII